MEDLSWKQADQALEVGDFETAVACYEEICAQQPNSEQSWYLLGLAHLLLNGPETAQGIWMNVIDPLNFEAIAQQMANLLNLLITEGGRQLKYRRFMSAEQLFRQALELDETSAAAYFGLGLALAQQGHYEAAIDVWQQSIVINPEHLEAYRLKAQTHEHIKEWSEAVATYRVLLAKFPKDNHAHHNLGRCLLHQKASEQALQALQEAHRRSPQDSIVSGDLGWAYFLQGQVLRAIENWHHTLALHPDYWQDFVQWQPPNTENSHTTAWQLNRNLIQALQSQDTAASLQALGDRFIALGWQAGAKRCYQALAKKKNPPNVEGFLPTNHTPEMTPSSATDASEPADLLPVPINVCEKTEDWVAAHPDQARYTPVFPASVIPLTPPESCDEVLHPSFRFGTGVPLPGAFVLELTHGRYWGETPRAVAAIAPDNTLLGDLSAFSPILSPGHPAAHPSQHPVLQVSGLPELSVVDGTVAVLAGLSDNVYFHWMIDLLPRLELLRRQGFTPDKVDVYLLEAEAPFQQEILTQLGIPLHKTLSPSQVPHLQATNLVVPSFPAAVAWMPRWVCDFLRQTFLPEAAATPARTRRVYISRAQAKSRRLINEPALIAALEPLGFEAIALETLSMLQKAALFAAAEIVVGLHGSGLTNIVFCQPGTPVIELFSPSYVYPAYWLIANWQALPYFYILGEAPEGPFFRHILYPDARAEDTWINPQPVLAALKKLGITPKQ